MGNRVSKTENFLNSELKPLEEERLNEKETW
jgi:hypothetical protein